MHAIIKRKFVLEFPKTGIRIKIKEKKIKEFRDKIMRYNLSLCLLIHITRTLRPLDGMTKDVLRTTTKVNGSKRTV